MQNITSYLLSSLQEPVQQKQLPNTRQLRPRPRPTAARGVYFPSAYERTSAGIGKSQNRDDRRPPRKRTLADRTPEPEVQPTASIAPPPVFTTDSSDPETTSNEQSPPSSSPSIIDLTGYSSDDAPSSKKTASDHVCPYRFHQPVQQAFKDNSKVREIRNLAKYRVLGKYDLFKNDIESLLPNEWVTDQAVLCALMVIQARANLNNPDASVHTCSPHFYQSVVVKREIVRTLKPEPFQQGSIFFPLNIQGSHWTLCIVNHEQGVIYTIDSLAPTLPVTDSARCIRNWMTRFFHHNQPDLSRKIELYPIQALVIPRQSNWDDCGVAVIWAAHQYQQGNLDLSADSQGDKEDAPAPYKHFRNNIIHSLRRCADKVVPTKTKSFKIS